MCRTNFFPHFAFNLLECKSKLFPFTINCLKDGESVANSLKVKPTLTLYNNRRSLATLKHKCCHYIHENI